MQDATWSTYCGEEAFSFGTRWYFECVVCVARWAFGPVFGPTDISNDERDEVREVSWWPPPPPSTLVIHISITQRNHRRRITIIGSAIEWECVELGRCSRRDFRIEWEDRELQLGSIVRGKRRWRSSLSQIFSSSFRFITFLCPPTSSQTSIMITDWVIKKPITHFNSIHSCLPHPRYLSLNPRCWWQSSAERRRRNWRTSYDKMSCEFGWMDEWMNGRLIWFNFSSIYRI